MLWLIGVGERHSQIQLRNYSKRLILLPPALCKSVSSESITSIWILWQTPEYFSVFSRELFPHNSICNFLLTVLCAAFATNLDKLGDSFNLLISCCCDSGYPWRTVIDWLLWCRCENPNSAVSTGDVTTSKPGAGATECIGEARGNSMHTLQPVGRAQCDPSVFLNSIKLNSLRSCVLNWGCSHFNHPILSAPFIEDFGSSIYENNGPSSV